MFSDVLSLLFGSVYESAFSQLKENKKQKKIEKSFEDLEKEITKKYGERVEYIAVIDYIKKNRIFERMISAIQIGDVTENITQIYDTYINKLYNYTSPNPLEISLLKDILDLYMKSIVSILHRIELEKKDLLVINQIGISHEDQTKKIDVLMSNILEILEILEKKSDGLVNNISEKQKYFDEIKKEINFNCAPDKMERIFIINYDRKDSLSDLLSLSKSIAKKFLKITTINNRKTIDSPAPYIFFKHTDNTSLCELTNKLYENDLEFIDGYPFLGSIFRLDKIVQSTTTQSNFKLKIIHNNSILEDIINVFDSANTNYYLFDIYQKELCNLSTKCFKKYDIKINSIKELNNYLFNE